MSESVRFYWSIITGKVDNGVILKLDSRYEYYFLDYLSYSGRALKLLKSMYWMTNSRNLFAYELTKWLVEEGFIQSQYQMSIYYKYAPDWGVNVVLSYVDIFFYWYTSEALRKMVCGKYWK